MLSEGKNNNQHKYMHIPMTALLNNRRNAIRVAIRVAQHRVFFMYRPHGLSHQFALSIWSQDQALDEA